ncbi:MAG: chitinase [Rhodocyclales bacterium]|nr:chitinase [Rhodocyclales bacterium]
MKKQNNRTVNIATAALFAIVTLFALPMFVNVAHAVEYLGGQTIDLRSSNGGKFASARIEQGGNLISTATVVQDWEKFDVVDAGGGWFALKARANGKFVSANQGVANAPLQAVASAVQLWEMFQIVDAGAGNIALKSRANNLYVSTRSDAGMALRAQAASIQGWETYHYDKISAATSSTPLLSSAQFDQMFPPSGRNGFYTYNNLMTAIQQSSGFASASSSTINKQEIAAFLANVAHETSYLLYVEEVNKSGNYCDASQSYGCPAGTGNYYGRGPIQLSWNYNYKAAGDYLGRNLLSQPALVAQDGVLTWRTAVWYWMTQNGPNTMTAHSSMVNSLGFGNTIRSINGSLECGKPSGSVGNNQMLSRVSIYNRFIGILGVSASGNSYC